MDPIINPSSRRHRSSGQSIRWEEEEQARDSAQAAIERRLHEMPSRVRFTASGSTQGQDGQVEQTGCENDASLGQEIATVIEVIDLTTERTSRRGRNIANPPKRNQAVALPDTLLDTYIYGDLELKHGTVVEMEPVYRLRQASFLSIQVIIRTEPGVILRGLPLTRTRNLRGQLPRLRNELAFVLEVDQDDKRDDEEQAAIEIPLSKVQGVRVCHVTNKDFPEHRFPYGVYRDAKEIEEKGSLACRWKYKLIWSDAVKRLNNKPPIEFVLSRVTSNQVPKERFRTSSSCLINKWRGGTIRGGSFIPGEPDSSRLTVNLDNPVDQDVKQCYEWIPKKPGQQYTFGDMFCGAGGTSCGARSAGFRIKLGCDNAEGACSTYREQFPEADLRKEDMHDFILSNRTTASHVDVLHLSPPCQYWSPAHTTPGVDDEANIAILFACHELVKIHRPRVFTVEQTFGILHPRFEYYFNALIYGFAQYGYSVRWKVVNLLTWGAPSQRQRLIMIGACPGEELPAFPLATHSKDRGAGTRPYRTVRQMLRKIPRDAAETDSLHNLDKLKPLEKTQWNPDVPLARTITCGGGIGNYHYSGKRDFTIREYAVLQGFPVDYQFQRPHLKRQIGNAFPPLVVETLYKHLRRCLEQKDLVYADSDESSDPEQESNYEDWGGLISDSDQCHGRSPERESDASDVEYLGRREINRATSVQCLGDQYVNEGSLTVTDSESDGLMEVDAMSDEAHSPEVYIDSVRPVGNDPSRPIELD